MTPNGNARDLALKLAGRPVSDDEVGPLTWDVWMDKT
jgi:hypothetical protein